MAHATYMAAMNAARKQFGKDWKESATLEKVDGQWYVQVNQVAEPLLPNHEVVHHEIKEVAPGVEFSFTTLAPIEPAPAVPALPAALTAPVEAPAAPALPKLPAFLLEAPAAPAEVALAEPGMIADALPQDDLDVAALQAEADAQADSALTANPFNNKVCPCCGSEELYNGRCDGGVVVDEEYIIGCHHCDWEVDTRTLSSAAAPTKTGALRPRISTTEKPTKKVWTIADSMPGAKRKDVIAECVRQGIAYGTARTQYQHWFKCVNDQKVAPIATIGADGKINFPTI